jgi:molybdenum cofactor cytidylyltransferase
MRFAVVPAGGKSTRMGRPKLSLPLGDRTVLEHVVGALRAGGVDHVLVVVGPHVRELAPLAERAGAHVCLLEEETPDMRATVEAGLRWLEEHLAPASTDDWLLVPADHPTLHASVVRALDDARREHPECSVFVPTFEGKRGHPTLIAWQHVPDIRAHPLGEGLNTYLRQHRPRTCEVPVADGEILRDLDTPEDYEKVLTTEAQRHREEQHRENQTGKEHEKS